MNRFISPSAPLVVFLLFMTGEGVFTLGQSFLTAASVCLVSALVFGLSEGSWIRGVGVG